MTNIAKSKFVLIIGVFCASKLCTVVVDGTSGQPSSSPMAVVLPQQDSSRNTIEQRLQETIERLTKVESECQMLRGQLVGALDLCRDMLFTMMRIDHDSRLMRRSELQNRLLVIQNMRSRNLSTATEQARSEPSTPGPQIRRNNNRSAPY